MRDISQTRLEWECHVCGVKGQILSTGVENDDWVLTKAAMDEHAEHEPLDAAGE